MRKLFLFLTVLTFGITLSSCLSVGNQNFAETSIVYIDSHGFTTYGKTLSGRAIYNDQISIMSPRTFKVMNYSWDEEYGVQDMDGVTLYKVVTTGDVIDLSQTELITGISNIERGATLKEIKQPVYDKHGVYFDDFWLFEYTYEGKEGQKPRLSFFLRENSQDENIKEIDIRLNLHGEAKEGAETRTYSDVIAVDMKLIRSMFLGPSNQNVRLKFFYFDDDTSENPTSSQNTWEMSSYDK